MVNVLCCQTERKRSRMGRTQKYSLVPISRVKGVMKTAPGVGHIGNNASIAMAKAVELFITLMTEEAWKKSNDGTLDYKNVADVVASHDRYKFLREYIPQKITVRRYKEILKETEDKEDEIKEFYLC